jgi:hypothetical protein
LTSCVLCTYIVLVGIIDLPRGSEEKYKVVGA